MIKAGFDFIAPWYDSLTHLIFRDSIRHAQLAFIKDIPAGSDILIIGGGTGWILKELYLRQPFSKILYLEASERMLRFSRKKMEVFTYLPNIEFRLGTEKSIKSEEKFDFIISPFLLDLFPPDELEPFCYTLRERLKQEGQWQVTDFVSPKGLGLRIFSQKVLLKLMYLFFRIFSKISAKELPDWEKTLAALGLKPQNSEYFYQGMIKSVLYRKSN